MKITRRIVDTKRHTVGFVVNNNKKVTRGEAVKLARRGKIKDVTAKKSSNGWYLSTLPSASYNLYDLPYSLKD